MSAAHHVEEVAKVAYAVVMQVNLVGDPVEGMTMLDEVVIPHAKAQPGFQRGTWMHSEAMTGTGVIVFDTEDHASAAMEALQPPPDGRSGEHPTPDPLATLESIRRITRLR